MTRRFPLFLATLLLWLAPARAAEDISIVFYNIANYLVMDRYVRGEGSSVSPKPEKEIEALIKILTEIKPDILGVCEMGGKKEFADFCERLKKAGIDLPHTEYVDASDDRHLALLSRFPIDSRQSLPDVSYEMNGAARKVNRGFLDVTVKVNADYQLRLLGAHLKSKRAVPEGEALIRRNEAHLLRQRISGILEKDPEVNLVAYGDFNDTKNEPAIREIMGPRGDEKSMQDVWLQDSVGDRWTHYWQTADIYSRIDYFFVNRALKPEVVESKSYVHRSPEWKDASDHRAIVLVVRPENRKP